MPLKDAPTWRKIATFFVSAVIVLVTYGLWAHSEYYGGSTDTLLLILALGITMAAASVVFGAKRLTNAFDELAEARTMQREMKNDDEK